MYYTKVSFIFLQSNSRDRMVSIPIFRFSFLLPLVVASSPSEIVTAAHSRCLS